MGKTRQKQNIKHITIEWMQRVQCVSNNIDILQQKCPETITRTSACHFREESFYFSHTHKQLITSSLTSAIFFDNYNIPVTQNYNMN